MRLGRPAHQMLLDSRDKRSGFGFTGLPQRMSRRDRIALPEEFEWDFHLYCAEGAEHEARAIFTPEVLRQIQRNRGQFHIEVIDDWILAYSNTEIVGTDARLWTWAFDLAAALFQAESHWMAAQPQDPLAQDPDTSSPVESEPVEPPEAAPETPEPAEPVPSISDHETPPPEGLQGQRPPQGSTRAENLPVVSQPGKRLRDNTPLVTIGIIAAVSVLLVLQFTVLSGR
ncbi:hypothetical protein HGQ17_08165 [Nesterenkonia sp. MY13]|uniref:Uncharacterized protein n=1 Tax=Nesterenkonia sedimenti TaxID=1463632 RepID=A0A7X8YE29_9MICC|nr:hypothetical protein [Nesterenkonia sedimenti]NLS09971.1 hypothetical protein [Nesterenkonia sedimenti]